MTKQAKANEIYFKNRDLKRVHILDMIVKYTGAGEAYASTLYAKAKKAATEKLRNAKSTLIDDGARKVYVGDWVGFKSDIEQSGEVIDIKRGYHGTELVLRNENGFSGDYLRYATETVEEADRCW